MNITWVHPAFLLLIPLFFALFLVRSRHQARSSISRPKVKHLLASPTGVSKSIEPGTRSRRGMGWFGLIALCLVAVALARPQWGEIEQKTFERSREVVIALDLSRSMLATDVPPNRLDRAKLLVDSLVKELEGERVGLVVFAGTSFVQCPLSNDYEILREMLKEVNPSFLPQQGTDFGKLLQTAYKAFDFSSTSDRFLIVLSDGEDLAGDWEIQLKSYIESDIHIISLGVGTAAGSVLPEKNGGVIKDEKGAVVLSRLDSRVLQELANKTSGRYVDAYRWVDLPEVISQTVDQGQRGEFAQKKQVLKMERFQIPLGLALFFALLSLWRDFPVYPRQTIKKPSLPLKPSPRPLRKKAVSSVPGATALFLLAFLPLTAQESPAPSQPTPEAKLSETVQAISSKDNNSPTDYAQLAGETIGYGKAQQQSKGKIEMGAINDALMGVDEGEALDPKAADWAKLRRELEDLKKKSSEQEQQKKDQQKQDKKDQQKKDEEQKQDQQQQNSGGSGEDDKDQKQDQKPSQSGKNSDQDQKEKDQKDPSSVQEGQDQQKPSSPKQSEKDQEQESPSKPNQDQDAKEEKDKQDAKNQPQPQPAEEKKEEPAQTKKVGGGGSNGEKTEQEQAPEGESAEMQRKLDQLKQKDSPGKIYQLFSPQEPSKEIKGKTW